LKHYNHGDWGTTALTVRHLLEGLATRLLTDTHHDASLATQLETLPQGVKPVGAAGRGHRRFPAPNGILGRSSTTRPRSTRNTAQQLLELAEQLVAYLVVLPGTMAELKSRNRHAPVPMRRGMTAA
jgi:hypothetical protein